MMCKLSLIVPIYGVENYIGRFLDSLTKNLIEGIEVILVDDGSKDRCPEIIDKFVVAHKQYVRAIHKSNGGVSSARNAGLDISNGEYILFVDPDDYLSENYVKEIFKAIDIYNYPDMILCEYSYVYSENRLKRVKIDGWNEGEITKKEFIEVFMENSDIQGSMWTKTIKRKFYKDTQFDTSIIYGEDYKMLTEVIIKVDTIVYIPLPLYYYCLNHNGSLSRNVSIDSCVSLCDIAFDRYQKYLELYANISNFTVISAYKFLLLHVYQVAADIDVTKYENYIRENIWNILRNPKFNFNNKKQYLLICLGLAKYYYRKNK